MSQYLTHKANLSREGVLCAPDSGKIFETPCIEISFARRWIKRNFETPCIEISFAPRWLDCV